MRAIQLVRLQELTDVVLENLECRDAHRADTHGFERDLKHGVVRQNNAFASEAHLWPLPFKCDRALKHFLEAVAVAVSYAGLEDERGAAFETGFGIDLEDIPLDARRMPARGESDEPAEVLPRVEPIREIDLNVWLLLAHRLNACDLENSFGGDVDVPPPAVVYANGRAIPLEPNCLGFALSGDGPYVELVGFAFAEVAPCNGSLLAKEACDEHLFDVIGVFCIRSAEHAAEDHASIARGARTQAVKLELESLCDDLEVENKAAQSSGDVLQSAAVQRHAVALTTGEILRRNEHDPTRIDEGQTARDRRLNREHRARVLADALLVDRVLREAHPDERFLGYRAARVRHDDVRP